jgi:RimJ/RimL family protein N-acetyltransferase
METARLRLRGFTPADAPALAAYRSDPEVSYWIKGEWTDDPLYGLLASEYRPLGKDLQR